MPQSVHVRCAARQYYGVLRSVVAVRLWGGRHSGTYPHTASDARELQRRTAKGQLGRHSAPRTRTGMYTCLAIGTPGHLTHASQQHHCDPLRSLETGGGRGGTASPARVCRWASPEHYNSSRKHLLSRRRQQPCCSRPPAACRPGTQMRRVQTWHSHISPAAGPPRAPPRTCSPPAGRSGGRGAPSPARAPETATAAAA